MESDKGLTTLANLVLSAAFIATKVFVVRDCWNWFPAKIFNLPTLTAATALGLTLTWTVAVMNWEAVETTAKVEDRLVALVALLLAWVIAGVAS